MGLLSAMIQEAIQGCRTGFDSRCGCNLPGHAEILAALSAVEPAPVDKLTTVLGVPWHHRGTIAVRLNELRRAGSVSRYGGKFRVVP